ncbi:MAG: nonstructural protein [Microvirus sp.]|nr:MAG: nonstructural protein [Microvirus sp.]
MRQVIVSVRDAKADIFGRPFFVQTAGVAIRSFSDEVNREGTDNQFNTHPEDFSLYEIGLYDDIDGKIYPYDIPKLLIQADQVKVNSKIYVV